MVLSSLFSRNLTFQLILTITASRKWDAKSNLFADGKKCTTDIQNLSRRALKKNLGKLVWSMCFSDLAISVSSSMPIIYHNLILMSFCLIVLRVADES